MSHMASLTAIARLSAFALILCGGIGCSSGAGGDSAVTRELRQILEADQNEPEPENAPSDPAQREAFFIALWTERFKPRHDRVITLIREGKLATAEDYYIAGMSLNHGIKPEDNLVAHALFSVAALKGHREARWGSAAALDNFLTSVRRPQLFGTVYGEGREVMGDPMTDALRREFCVPSVARQGELMKLIRSGDRDAFDRQKIDCP